MNTTIGLQTVMDYFKRNAWNFQLDANRPVLLVGFKGQNCSFRCFVTEDDTDDFLQFISVIPLAVPLHKRAAVMELCMRLSHPIKVGGYEMNPENGEIWFRTYSAHAPGQLPEEVIRRVIGFNLLTADLRFPAFTAVLYNDLTPEAAVTRLRSDLPIATEIQRKTPFLTPSRLGLN